jgi:hypothetical protein
VTGEDPRPEHRFVLVNAREPKWTGEVEVREAYVAWRDAGFELSAGQRLFVWGKNDVLPAADVLNPVDLRYDVTAALTAPRDRKAPVLALQGAYAWNDAALELVILPFFAPHRLTLAGRDMAVLPPVAPALAAAQRFGGLHPSVEDQLQQAFWGTEVPEESPASASVALRGSTQVAGWDIAATAFYGWDRTPMLSVDADLRTLVAAGERVAASPELVATDPGLRSATVAVQE